MTTQAAWFETVSLPALLRHARSAYGQAMRRALDAAGFDDVPANGMYVLGGLAEAGGSARLRPTVAELGVSERAAGQMVDALVQRGYLVRGVDPEDPRIPTIGLTDRGSAAATVQRKAREGIDAELEASVGDIDVGRTRRTLAVLCDIGRQSRETTGDPAE